MMQYKELENGYLQLDNQYIPNEIANRFYAQALAQVEAGEAEILPYVEPEPNPEIVRKQAMLKGVEFQGVMCSVTKEDMWGLASVKDYVYNGLEIAFNFENGNTLILNRGNIDEFEKVWAPFRGSFF